MNSPYDEGKRAYVLEWPGLEISCWLIENPDGETEFHRGYFDALKGKHPPKDADEISPK